MQTWAIQLAGDEVDLNMLAASLDRPELRVSESGKMYYLESSSFSPSDDAETIYKKGVDLIAFLNGASSLAFGGTRTLELAYVRHQDNGGKVKHIVFPPCATAVIRMIPPTITFANSDGEDKVFRPADDIQKWYSLSTTVPAVYDVCRLLDQDERNWSDLYRILDIVENEVGGRKRIVERKWATVKELKTFRGTANSPEVSGLDARHGARGRYGVPSTTMSLTDARDFIDSIVCEWLQMLSRNANASTPPPNCSVA